MKKFIYTKYLTDSLLNKDNFPIGLISYTSNHTTYTPRKVKYDPLAIDHAHHRDGGRMSQLYMDIHQGALQNWQLIKNDQVFYGNEITNIGRQHPYIGTEYTKKIYDDAYEKDTVSPKDLLKSFILYSGGVNISNEHLNLLSTIENQKLTNKLFSKFYEEIAEDYESNSNRNHKAESEKIIELKNFK